jgi:hypothetical protein
VADLHTQNIDQGFLSTLGPGFLSLLYRAIDENPESTLIVAYEDGAVCGFIAGTVNLKQVYRGLLRRWPALVVALAPSLVMPSRLWRILEILRYSRGTGADAVSLPEAELLEKPGTYHGNRDC